MSDVDRLRSPPIGRNWWLFLIGGLVSVDARGPGGADGARDIDAILGVLILLLPGLSLVMLAVLFAVSLLLPASSWSSSRSSCVARGITRSRARRCLRDGMTWVCDG